MPAWVPQCEKWNAAASSGRAGGRDHQFTGSTDGVPVHSKYSYHKPLLQARVEVYEIKPYRERAARTAAGQRARTERITGSVDLHARTFDFDRRIGFVGSYNLDPRSSKLNTEMGVLFDCPKLVRRSPETLERNIAQNGIIASNSWEIASSG